LEVAGATATSSFIGGATFATGGGNVGIGTTSPSQELSVAGNAYVTGTSYLMGNVGVGTAAPAGAFHIVGSTMISERVGSDYGASWQFRNDGTTKWILQESVLGGDTGIFTFSDASANRVFTLMQGGKVGIGSTSPTNRFSVAGGFIDVDGTTGGYKIDNNLILQASSTNFSTLVGQSAGAALNTTGLYNTALGYEALKTATTSDNNVAIGYQALSSVWQRDGGYSQSNTAIGYQALKNSTTGYLNVAVGYLAGTAMTTGQQNVAIGAQALQANQSGSNNMALGYLAMSSIVGGNNNSAVGRSALSSNVSGSDNMAEGPYALFYSTNSGNLGIGAMAGVGGTGGYSAGVSNHLPDQRSTGDSYMTFLGTNSSRSERIASTTALTGGVAIGYAARVGASYSMALGGEDAYAVKVGVATSTPWARLSVAGTAGQAATIPLFTISNSTAGAATSTVFHITNLGLVGIGTAAPTNALDVESGFIDVSGTLGGYKIDNNLILQASSTNKSTLVGQSAGAALLADGLYNTAVGYQALDSATSTDNNTAIGYAALSSVIQGGNDNTAVGYGGLLSNTTGDGNAALGMDSLYFNTSGRRNSAFGTYALYKNTTGNYNVGFGPFSLYNNTEGTGNVGIGGVDNLYYLTTGIYNTAIGGYAGTGNLPDERSITDEYMTFIGTYASRSAIVASTTKLTGGVAIGYQATVGASYSMALGGEDTYALKVGVATSTPWGRFSIAGTAGQASTIPLFTVSSSTAAYATSTAFIIDNNGKVGIGTSSPSGTNSLAVQGQSYFAGNVGIGKANPANTLHVSGGNASLRVDTWTAGNNYFVIQNGTASLGAQIATRNSDSGNPIQLEIIGSPIIFNPTTTGNVGIGTSSPGSKLSITQGSTGQGFYLAGSSLNTSPLFSISSSTASATTTAFIIDSTGKVGVGTTSPWSQLSVEGNVEAKSFSVNGVPLSGAGTVTSVATDATLTGGPIINTGTLGLNLANANTWTGLQTFANATTTLLSATYASSTSGYFGNLYIPSLASVTGNVLAVNTTGKLIATTTDGSGLCTSGVLCTGGHTHDVANLQWANDWMIAYSNGSGLVELPLSTGSGKYLRSNGEAAPTWETPTASASSTLLADTNTWIGLNKFFNIGTTTFTGGIEAGTLIGAPYFNATSTTATSTFMGGWRVGTSGLTGFPSGMFGIGSSSPYAQLSINAPAQTTPYFAIGSSTEVFKISPSSSSSLSLGTTTTSGAINIGGTSTASSTIMWGGKFQIDTYDNGGTRRCVFMNSAGTLTTSSGACNQ
jgi:hypothetical protein